MNDIIVTGYYDSLISVQNFVCEGIINVVRACCRKQLQNQIFILKLVKHQMSIFNLFYSLVLNHKLGPSNKE